MDRLVRDADVVFLALPEAASAELAPTLLERGVRVIDLSGAFRIRTQADRQRWAPGDSRAARRHRLRMTEGNQDATQARLVSNPGCYPTAALLALEPLAAAGLLDGAVYVDAKSGVSGAGKTPSDRTHFSENHGSVAAHRSSHIGTPRRSSRSSGERSRSSRISCRWTVASSRPSTDH